MLVDEGLRPIFQPTKSERRASARRVSLPRASLADLLRDEGVRPVFEATEFERRVREETEELVEREKEVGVAERLVESLSVGGRADNDQEDLRMRKENALVQKKYAEEKRKAKRRRVHGEIDGEERDLEISGSRGIRSDEPVREMALDPKRSIMQEPYFRTTKPVVANYSHIYDSQFTSRDVALEQVIKDCRNRAPLPPRDEDEAMDMDPELNTREEEEARLHTPFPGERPCREGEKCIAFDWSGGKDILVEWLGKRQLEEKNATGKLPDLLGKCLRCLRAAIVYNYEAMRNLYDGCPGRQLISEFRNDIRRDYHPRHCFLPEDDDEHFHGLSYPVVAEVPSLYERRRIGEVWYHIQLHDRPDRQNFLPGPAKMRALPAPNSFPRLPGSATNGGPMPKSY